MASEFVSLATSASVDEAIHTIRDVADDMPNLYAIYAVDDAERLRGVVPLSALLLAKRGAVLESLSIFGIWFLILFTVGVSVVYGISRKAAIVPVLVVWLLGVVMLMLEGLGG